MSETGRRVGIDLSVLVSGLSELWSQTLGDPRISVAVLDGTVDVTHPCFAGTDISTIPTLVPGIARGGAATRHGTAVASILFGRHGSDVSGIAPECKGLVAPVFAEDANGQVEPCSHVDLSRAMSQAVAAGVRIINISGGELVGSSAMDWPLSNVMKLCNDEDVLVVAAAGNDGCACIHLPAAAPNALVVGAMDGDGQPSSFSNYGKEYRAHGILAPGENVPAANPGGGVALRSGTSYAAPIVSGVAALLMSRELRQGRRIRSSDVCEVLLESAINCETNPTRDCDRLFRGRLNIPGAIQLLDASANKAMMEVGTAMESSRTNSDPNTVLAAPSTRVLQPTQQLGVPMLGVLPQGDDSATGAEPITVPTVTTTDGATDVSSRGVFEPSPAIEMSDAVTAPVASTNEDTALNRERLVSQDCGCSRLDGPGSLVFALGALGFDFGSESIRDSVYQANGKPICDNQDLYDYLVKHPSDAEHVIWTVAIDSHPVYAISPAGPFGEETYQRLMSFLEDPDIERISIPGVLTATNQTLLDGQVLPVVEPDLAGMSSWSTDALVDVLIKDFPPPPPVNAILLRDASKNFLNHVYFGMRNLGISPQDRTLNFAVTNAYAVYCILTQATLMSLQFVSVEIERSPLCRLDSDCWDIVLTFLDPYHQNRLARRTYRYTVDVSDVEPVQIGSVRNWHIPATSATTRANTLSSRDCGGPR